MSFCENLRSARENRGLTQQQVADLMGIDKSTYCGYETGKRQPDVCKLKQLSGFLNVPVDELLETGYEKASSLVKSEEAWNAICANHTKLVLATWISELEGDDLVKVSSVLGAILEKRSPQAPKE